MVRATQPEIKLILVARFQNSGTRNTITLFLFFFKKGKAHNYNRNKSLKMSVRYPAIVPYRIQIHIYCGDSIRKNNCT
jgi:hypothetical protein